MSFAQHMDNMRVAQTRLHKGDTRFYIQSSNGIVVRGPFLDREQAEDALERRRRFYQENPEEAE